MGRVVEGSSDALALLYDRHAAAVLRTADRFTRNPGIAAEIVQETFLALWNRAELYDPARGSLRAWLTTIARNRALDHLRSVSRRDRALPFSAFGDDLDQDLSTAEWLANTGDPVGMATSDAGPEDALVAGETRALVAEALAGLAPLERSVMVLAYGEGLSQSEIAVRLDWPIGTVKTRTRRALRHLRERLEASTVAAPSAPQPRGARAPVRGPERAAPSLGSQMPTTVRGT